MHLLAKIATSRLPMALNSDEDIDKVRILRSAGLVIALVPPPIDTTAWSGPDRSAQVIALTQKGREELQDPGEGGTASTPTKPSGMGHFVRNAAKRAVQGLNRE